jgi:hypothetical protein
MKLSPFFLILIYVLLTITAPVSAKNCPDFSGKYFSAARYETKTVEQQGCLNVRFKNCVAHSCSSIDLVIDGKWRTNSKDGRILNHERGFFDREVLVVQYRWGQINYPSIQGTTRFSLTQSHDLLTEGIQEDLRNKWNQSGKSFELWKRIRN